MAVAHVATDTWIQHLLFTGGRRQTPYGPVDGIWYGLVAGDGDASAGNLTLNGNLSFERKEDWVYILGHISATANVAAVGDVFTQVNTGPLIPTAAAASTVTNPSFTVGGLSSFTTNNALSSVTLNTGGADPRAGLPIFGDKRLAGSALICAVAFENNVDLATYQMSVWGYLVNYSGFFRNINPVVG